MGEGVRVRLDLSSVCRGSAHPLPYRWAYLPYKSVKTIRDIKSKICSQLNVQEDRFDLLLGEPFALPIDESIYVLKDDDLVVAKLRKSPEKNDGGSEVQNRVTSGGSSDPNGVNRQGSSSSDSSDAESDDDDDDDDDDKMGDQSPKKSPLRRDRADGGPPPAKRVKASEVSSSGQLPPEQNHASVSSRQRPSDSKDMTSSSSDTSDEENGPDWNGTLDGALDGALDGPSVREGPVPVDRGPDGAGPIKMAVGRHDPSVQAVVPAPVPAPAMDCDDDDDDGPPLLVKGGRKRKRKRKPKNRNKLAEDVHGKPPPAAGGDQPERLQDLWPPAGAVKGRRRPREDEGGQSKHIYFSSGEEDDSHDDDDEPRKSWRGGAAEAAAKASKMSSETAPSTPPSRTITTTTAVNNTSTANNVSKVTRPALAPNSSDISCEELLLRQQGEPPTTPAAASKSGRRHSAGPTVRSKVDLDGIMRQAKATSPVYRAWNKVTGRVDQWSNRSVVLRDGDGVGASEKVLEDLPSAGQRISFKVLEMSESYEPRVSERRTGVVVSVDPVQKRLEVRHAEGVGVLRRPNGKFEIESEEAPDDEAVSLGGGHQDGDDVQFFCWNQLIEPRLVSD